MTIDSLPWVQTGIAGTLAFLLGLFWYHPKVLGGRWLKARGGAPDLPRADLPRFAFSFLLWLLAACFYAFLAAIMNIHGAAGLLSLSCLLWVAFAMPPLVMGSLYTGYPFEAVAIDAAYQLAGYYVFAAVHMILSVPAS